jgi:uncharacterized membrane protein SpoIIM required for sporulation
MLANTLANGCDSFLDKKKEDQESVVFFQLFFNNIYVSIDFMKSII